MLEQQRVAEIEDLAYLARGDPGEGKVIDAGGGRGGEGGDDLGGVHVGR